MQAFLLNPTPSKGNMNPWILVPTTCFEEKYANIVLFTKSGRKSATCGATSTDYIVKILFEIMIFVYKTLNTTKVLLIKINSFIYRNEKIRLRTVAETSLDGWPV